jgi:hypothetical protein
VSCVTDIFSLQAVEKKCAQHMAVVTAALNIVASQSAIDFLYRHCDKTPQPPVL